MTRSRSTTIALTGMAWDHPAITYACTSTRAVNPGTVAAVLRAVRHWNAGIARSPVSTLHDFRLVAAPARQRPDIEIRVSARRGRILGSTQLFPRTDGSLARATVALSGQPFGHELDADVVTTIAVQELGHALGLGHADDPADPMYAYFNRAKLHPSACDVYAFGVAVAWYRDPVDGRFYPPAVACVNCAGRRESPLTMSSAVVRA